MATEISSVNNSALTPAFAMPNNLNNRPKNAHVAMADTKEEQKQLLHILFTSEFLRGGVRNSIPKTSFYSNINNNYFIFKLFGNLRFPKLF